MKIIDCPYCNQPGAEKSLFRTRCPNPACPAYDPEMRGGLAVRQAPASTRAEAPGRLGGPADAAPKPGELLPQAGEGSPGGGPSPAPGPVRKTVQVKVKAPGCGWSMALWVAAYLVFRYGVRHGTVWMIVAAVLAFLAWRSGRVQTAVRKGPTREEVRQVTHEPVIEYVEPFDTGGEHRVEIRYRNWKGEEKVFVGDRRTMRRRGRHLSLRVAPEGIRISLALDRIQNLPEVGTVPGP
jgi:hypothetical protein